MRVAVRSNHRADSEPYLVPGRTCGECTACCRELAIVADGMKKLPGVACVHCTAGAGCSIYAERPQVCRSYHCLWRSIPGMADAWRPDRSGIMMVPCDLPPGFEGPFAVNLVVIGAPAILQTEAFAGMAAGFIESGTATYLDVPGAPGMFGHHRLLNDMLTPAIRARDLAAVKGLIWEAYQLMKAAPTRAITDDDLLATRPAPISA